MTELLALFVGFVGGMIFGNRHAARIRQELADLRAARDKLELQAAAWKEAAAERMDEIKSRF